MLAGYTKTTVTTLTSSHFALLFIGLVMTACVAQGEILIRQNFDGIAAGKWPDGKQPVGTVAKFEGDASAPLGTVGVAKVAGPRGPTSAVQIANVLHKENRAPALSLRWQQPATGVVRVEYSFMSPVDGPFLSVHYFGGDWKTGAAVVMIDNDKVSVQFGKKDARLVIGESRPSEWVAMRLDFDVKDKTVTIYVNGKKRANRLPWQSTAVGIAKADLFADFKSTDHGGAPVLFVDDVTVQTLPPGK